MRLTFPLSFCLIACLAGCSTGNIVSPVPTASTTTTTTPQAPVANVGAAYTGTAGAAVSFSAAGSSDPQGHALTYAWNFGDGGTGSAVSPSHAYAAAGTYTVSLTVTDASGLTAVAMTTATIAAAPPVALPPLVAPPAATPVFSPVGGTYTSAQMVSITSATPGATIYYTTNGAVPTASSSVYSGPVPVGNSETLEATALAPGVSTSAVATAAYVVNLPVAPTVVASLGATSFSPTSPPIAAVQVTCGSACGQVDFRIDGNQWQTAALDMNGSYSTSAFPQLAAGTHTLQVFYLGNGSYVVAASNVISFTVVPVPTISSAALAFPTTQYGTVSAPLSLTITAYNNDPVSLALGVSANTPFQIAQGTSCPRTPCTLSVTFAPTLTTANSNSIAITDSVFGGTVQVALSGAGTAPPGSLALSPSSLTFAAQAVGYNSIPQIVTLSNTGTTVLSVSSIALAGVDPADFILTNGCGSTLTAGASCSFTVSFGPAAVGARTASVQITSNATTSPDMIPLNGAGMAGGAITGTAYAGQRPVAGARVYLLAANISGYGRASMSLLNAASTGTSDSVGAYVLTNSAGGFSLTGEYSCTSGQQVYLYALGGNSGSGENLGSGLMAAIGRCPGAATAVKINEVTTVAAAYALAGFATDATHVSSSATAAAQLGVANAFASAGNLVTLATGVALASTPGGNGTVPQSEINMLADILATCVESSAGCSTLFNMVTPLGGSAPTETVGAILDIAHHPANRVSTLYGLVNLSSPYQPIGASAPAEWTIGVVYNTINQSAHSVAMALDGLGDVWLASYTASAGPSILTELSNTGVVLSGTSGYSIAGAVSQISIDPAGNVWAASGSNGIVKVSSSGSTLLTLTGTQVAGMNDAASVAIDGSGNAWVGNSGASGLFKLGNDGTVLSSSYGFSTGTAQSLNNIAIDGLGDAWVATNNANLLEYSNAGVSLSGVAGYAGGGRGPIALDASGNAWTYGGNNYVYERSGSGVLLSPSIGDATCDPTGAAPHSCAGSFPGAVEPLSVAIDGLGNVWSPVIYYGPNSGQYLNGIAELSGVGAILSGGLGYATSGSEGYYPSLLQVDSSGNLWGVSPTAVTELIGVAAPAETPLSAAVRDNKLGSRP